MSPEQRALLNKRRCELYATKKSAKMLQKTPKKTVQSTCMVIKLFVQSENIIGPYDTYYNNKFLDSPSLYKYRSS